MKFSAAVLALAAGANAFKNVTYTTEIVTAITTFCPEPTTVEYGGTTYTITEVRIRLLDRRGRRSVWESSGSTGERPFKRTKEAKLPWRPCRFTYDIHSRNRFTMEPS